MIMEISIIVRVGESEICRNYDSERFLSSDDEELGRNIKEVVESFTKSKF